MSNKYIIKSEFNNDLRRFTVNEPITLEDLTATLKNLYKIDKDDVRLKYKDEDGDSISITTEDEFNEALNFAQENKNLLRVSLNVLPLNLDSWVIVDSLPAVQELCKDIKQLSEQLKASAPIIQHQNETPSQIPLESNNNNNDNDNGSQEIAPTALQASQNVQQCAEEYELPSWGKSMSGVGLQQQIIEGQKTSGGDDDEEIPTAIQHKREKISSIVSEYSSNVVHDLKEITSKIASLVIEKGASFPLEMKDDLIQTNMKLAEMTIANCQTFSNNAARFCNQFSDMAVSIVNSSVDSTMKVNEDQEANDQICNNLRSKTIEDCNSFSSKTAENCVKGADTIRDLIMNL